MNAPSQAAEVAGAQPASFDFETTFRAHYERIARVIARVLDDPGRAEELAVEAFWRLSRNPAAQGEAAPGWLYRTAVRLALDELRRRVRRTRYERMLAWVPWAREPRTPDELLSSSQEQGRVRAVLAALPARQAELLVLRSDGLSYAELASSLALNPASVGTLLSRAQQAFRKEYVKRYGER